MRPSEVPSAREVGRRSISVGGRYGLWWASRRVVEVPAPSLKRVEGVCELSLAVGEWCVLEATALYALSLTCSQDNEVKNSLSFLYRETARLQIDYLTCPDSFFVLSDLIFFFCSTDMPLFRLVVRFCTCIRGFFPI